MIVAYTGTRNIYRTMMPSIRSLLDHNDVEKIYLIIEDNVFPEDLPPQVEIRNMSKQKYVSMTGPNSRNYFTYMSQIKLAFSLFLECNRVIALDPDTIICDSLLPIWEMDLTGKWFAGVPEEFKTTPETIYINGGVVVYNLEQMRKDAAADKLLDLINHQLLAFPDQDALARFSDKCAKLPIRYNENTYTGRTDTPAIIHYAGIGDWFDRRNIRAIELVDRYKKAL